MLGEHVDQKLKSTIADSLFTLREKVQRMEPLILGCVFCSVQYWAVDFLFLMHSTFRLV